MCHWHWPNTIPRPAVVHEPQARRSPGPRGLVPRRLTRHHWTPRHVRTAPRPLPPILRLQLGWRRYLVGVRRAVPGRPPVAPADAPALGDSAWLWRPTAAVRACSAVRPGLRRPPRSGCSDNYFMACHSMRGGAAAYSSARGRLGAAYACLLVSDPQLGALLGTDGLPTLGRCRPRASASC